GIDDVYAAGRRLRDRIHRTPTLGSQSFNDASGYRVFFKCENLQRAGSFKIRGALNKLLSLPDADRARGVVAYSSGNHAQGVALAARMVGSSAIICMPTDAPAPKVEATRNYGAEIVFYDRLKDDRAALAGRIAAETGRVLVPPYDDYAIIAGQGTAALELFQDVPALDALVTPVGGGGLMAGCATVAKSLFPATVVIGVEADTANDTYLSLQKGERVTIAPPPTIADGIRVTSPGALDHAAGVRMARCGWAPSHAASPSSRSRERVSSTPPPRLTRDGAPRSATVEGRDYLRGQPFELIEHALGRAHGPHDELRGPA